MRAATPNSEGTFKFGAWEITTRPLGWTAEKGKVVLIAPTWIELKERIQNWGAH